MIKLNKFVMMTAVVSALMTTGACSTAHKQTDKEIAKSNPTGETPAASSDTNVDTYVANPPHHSEDLGASSSGMGR